MRFESESNSKAGKSDEFVRRMRAEIETLCSKLLSDRSSSGRAEEYFNLLGMVNDVADYIFRKNDAARKEIDEYMNGKILKLRSEIVFEQGEAEGLKKGRANTLYELVSEDELSPSSAADRLGVSVDQLKADMIKAGFSFPEIQPA